MLKPVLTPVDNHRLPGITLEAVVSKRKVRLDRIGRPAVLLFHDQHTAEAMARINPALRADFPGADELLIASLINLKSVPRLLRGVAESAMRRAYEIASGYLPERARPEDYVVILPDWEGKAYAAVGIRHVDRRPGMAVVDAQGTLLALLQDEPGALIAAAQRTLRDRQPGSA